MFAFVKKMLSAYGDSFAPKIVEVLKHGYTLNEFRRDSLAGLTVSVVSMPLAMALSIASGVTPAQGMYTAIVAGFFISLLGGSRYQIGGPTSAFVVVILNVMQTYGYNGLALTMIVAGVTLIIAGYFKLGTYIKYIPYPVVVGFTVGIGLLLISTQLKDFLGYHIASLPADFVAKIKVYVSEADKVSWQAIMLSILSLSVIFYLRYKKSKIPAYLAAVVVSTLLVFVFGLNVDTIGSKFGGLPHFLPMPKLPQLDLEILPKVIPSGLTIAFLTSIESLLSATVVDSMSGDNHNPNAEIIGEGFADLICLLFTGVPATGAIARTATNFKAKAYSPVAGMMQSVFLLLFMLVFAPAAQYIPLACLATVLMLIGINMLSFAKVYKLLTGLRGDRYTLLATILLTILVDLNTAISVGFIMASIIFMHRMSKQMEIETDEQTLEYTHGGRDLNQMLHEKGVMSIRMSGPLFFGTTANLAKSFRKIGEAPKVLIIRMGFVPMVDASGANAIVEFVKKLKKYDTKIIFSNVKKQPRRVLKEAFQQEGLHHNVVSAATTFENAVKMAQRYLKKPISAAELKAAEAIDNLEK